MREKNGNDGDQVMVVKKSMMAVMVVMMMPMMPMMMMPMMMMMCARHLYVASPLIPSILSNRDLHII